MRRWLAFSLLAASFAAAVLLKGGVYAQQWEWSALGISAAALLALAEPDAGKGERPILLLVAALSAWMLLPLIPLPPSVVNAFAPDRWQAAQIARSATSQPSDAWLPLSTAPGATLERLLDVLPALATFLTARQMGSWWPGNPWIAFAPVVLIAWIESLIGTLQFYFSRTSATPAFPSGTYVYHNHFAGLLEIALPMAATWAAWSWRNGSWRRKITLPSVALTALSACLVMGILFSLSRMGLIATLAAGAAAAIAWKAQGQWTRWRLAWLLVPIALLTVIPTEMVGRFGQLATETSFKDDDRAQIWRDSLKLVASSPWTGTGLGAYEHGLFRFKTALPENAVDFAHNDYLQILAELGVPGALLAAALAAWILARAIQAVRRRGDPHWEFSIGLLAVLVALGVHSLVDFNLYLPANALALAWASGLAVSPTLERA